MGSQEQWGGGAGSLQKVREENVGGGIPKGIGAGRSRKYFCNIVQYFEIEKTYRQDHYRRGWNWKIQDTRYEKWEVKTPPPSPIKSLQKGVELEDTRYKI